jgi:hypothetical protein
MKKELEVKTGWQEELKPITKKPSFKKDHKSSGSGGSGKFERTKII